MSLLYRKIKKDISVEQTIEKSKFIAHIKYVETREDAEDFIKEIKTLHKDATHNVPAMVIGDKFQLQWASDDGEPQGTSGAPIAQMLVKEKISNVVVVVTRYYGGVKLGTGGLVRAYTSSAKLAINAATLEDVTELASLKYNIEYSILTKFQSMEGDSIFKIASIEYSDIVQIEFIVALEDEAEMRHIVESISSGRAKEVHLADF